MKRMLWAVTMKVIMAKHRGSLEELSGRAWAFVVIVAGIVMVFGPMVYHLVTNALSGSVNTVSSSFNFDSYS